MAEIWKWTDEKIAAWNDWLKDRPAIIKELATRFPPNKLYLLDSGHRVYVYSYCEDGSLTVTVSGKYNLVAFERNVFGIRPETLAECDLPTDEPVGSANMDIQEVREAMLKITQHERN